MAAPNDNDATRDRFVPVTPDTDGTSTGASNPEVSPVLDATTNDEDPEELRADMAIAEEAEARYRESGLTGAMSYDKYRAGRVDGSS